MRDHPRPSLRCRTFLPITLWTALGAACSTARPAPQAAPASAPGAASDSTRDAAAEAALELVESAPVETTLDHPDLRKAKDVWPQMFARAKKSIDLAEFYVSELPDSALSPSLSALEAAAARGVKVRLLADGKMARTYPETLARLAKEANVQVEQIDFHALAGGVQHAKYFVIDAGEATAESVRGEPELRLALARADPGDRPALPGPRGGARARGHLRDRLGIGGRGRAVLPGRAEERLSLPYSRGRERER